MITIGFIRHGQTEWNVEKRNQGHSDVPLNDLGIAQAKKIAGRIKNESWDIIYASDLKRAKKTAEIIGEAAKIPVKTDRRLRERHGGKIDGTTEAERVARWGENWETLDLQVETSEQMSERGLPFFHKLLETTKKKNILIVSHGAFLKQMLREFFPDEDVEQSLGNCSLTIVEWEEESWRLILHNCMRHM